MRTPFFILVCITTVFSISAQVNLEVEGKVQISHMDLDNNADSIVVRQLDGTLAIRKSSELNVFDPWYVGLDTLGGIVFYLYKDTDGVTHGLIVDTLESMATWQDAYGLVNADRSWDGPYNTLLMDDTGNSPAKNWTDSRSSILPGNWYLPSVDEMSFLFQNRFHVNKGLFHGGYSTLSHNTYWTSTECNLTTAYRFSFNSGSIVNDCYPGSGNKLIPHTVRAIRSF